MSADKHSRRNEQRAAKSLAAESDLTYAQALNQVRAGRDEAPAFEPSERDYLPKLTQLCQLAQTWFDSYDEDDECFDYDAEDRMRHSARQELDWLREDGHLRREKLDMTEVTRSRLRQLAEHITGHQELSEAYDSHPFHSAYEADEELERGLRLAQRFLGEASDEQFRARYTHADNPLVMREPIPVPEPDLDGETVDGIRQGTVLRDLYSGELRTLLTGPVKDSALGVSVRLSDPRDGEQPKPGQSDVFGGFWCLAGQLTMLFAPATHPTADLGKPDVTP